MAYNAWEVFAEFVVFIIIAVVVVVVVRLTGLAEAVDVLCVVTDKGDDDVVIGENFEERVFMDVDILELIEEDVVECTGD